MRKIWKKPIRRTFMISAFASVLVAVGLIVALRGFSVTAGDNLSDTVSQSDNVASDENKDLEDVDTDSAVDQIDSSYKPNANFSGTFFDELTQEERNIYVEVEQHFFIDKDTSPLVYEFSNPYTSYDDAMDMTHSAISAFFLDYPEFFWLHEDRFSPNYNEGYYPSVTIKFKLTYPNAYNEITTVNNGVQVAVNAIEDMGPFESIYDEVMAIHDYLCNRMSYDTESKGSYLEAYTIAPCFGGGRRGRQFVCDGYAKAFQLLCNRLGIPCIRVVGYGESGRHAWNYVQMEDDRWYAVDVTWDDNDTTGVPRRNYFLVGQNTLVKSNCTFSQNHTFRVDYYEGIDTYYPLAYPPLSGEKYIYTGYTVYLGTDFYAYIINDDVWTNATNDNGNVSCYGETGYPSQIWKFQWQNDHTYKIINMYDNYCLDVNNASGANGANVGVAPSNDSDAQRWYIYEVNGLYRLRAKCTNCYLDLQNGSGSDGTNLRMKTLNGSTDQLFRIWKIDHFKEIVNLGDEFFRVILMSDPWITITNSNGNVVLSKEVGNATQVWKFRRTPEGAYYIISAKDGKYLSVPGYTGGNGANVCMQDGDGSDNQKWFIHYEYDGVYSVSSACNGVSRTQMLTVANSSTNDGTNVYTYAWEDAKGQMFSFYGGEECVPLKGTVLSVSPGTSQTDTSFTWSWVYGYDTFNLRLWNGTCWNGDSIYSDWNNTGFSHHASLQAGYYEGYVDTCNALDYKMSNIVCFTVKPSMRILKQVSGEYRLSWSPVLSAKQYMIEVFNTQTNKLVFSQVYDMSTTSVNISLGAGEYKAEVVALLSQTYTPSDGSAAISSITSDFFPFSATDANSATSITLSKTNLTLKKGDKSTLTATVTPANCSDSVVWSSSNTSVATVSNGTVTAVGYGTATITARAGSKSAYCTVTVQSQPTTYPVTLSKSSLSMVVTDNNPMPTASLSARKPSSVKTLVWYSDEPDIASVSQSGKVTAYSPGVANIYCKSESGQILSAPCRVTVRLFIIDIDDLACDETTDYINGIISIPNTDEGTVEIWDSAPTSDPLVWKSSNSGVMSISSNGYLRCRGKKGTVTITATRGKISTSIKLRAYQPTESLKLNNNNFWIYAGRKVSMKAIESKGADEPVYWDSTDYGVVYIDEKGVLKGISQGIATISAYTTSGIEVRTKVMVRTKATGFTWSTIPERMNPRAAVKFGIGVNTTKELNATITAPSNCNDTVTWTTSNKSIVEIVSFINNGKGIRVRGLKKGTATITAKTGSGKKVTYKITVVPQAAQQIQLNRNAVSIYKGASVSLSAKVLPKGCNDVVMWKSSNTSVARVDENGRVTAVSQGNATITAYSALSGSVADTATINVMTKAAGLTWSTVPEGMTPSSTVRYVFRQNEGTDLGVKITSPSNCNDTIKWTCSNNKVAEINHYGNSNNTVAVFGIKPGKATITAKTGSGKKVTYQIVVVADFAKDVLLNKHNVTVYKGYTTSLSATTTPKGYVVYWKSSDTSVATVNENGKVTAVSNGKATITAYTSYFFHDAVCDEAEITVITKATKVESLFHDAIIDVGESILACATVTPENCGDTVTWTSSNTSIATVSPGPRGTMSIKGLKPGTCTITIRTGSGKTDKIKIIVRK